MAVENGVHVRLTDRQPFRAIRTAIVFLKDAATGTPSAPKESVPHVSNIDLYVADIVEKEMQGGCADQNADTSPKTPIASPAARTSRLTRQPM